MTRFSKSPARMAMLAALMLIGASSLPERSAGAFGRTQAVLSEKNFFADHHRIIFREMVCLSSGGSALDSGTLKSALETRGLLDQIGGVAYLGRLTEGVPYSGNFEHYARLVEDRAIRRALMARHILATQACTNGHETSELLETGVAPYRETLAADLEARRRVQPTLEVMAGYSVSVARGPGRKVWTAFRDLGDATSAIAPGEVLTTVA